MSEDCFRYGSENNTNDALLAKAASLYGGALRNVEKEHEDFNKLLSLQVIYSIFGQQESIIFSEFNRIINKGN